MSNQPTLFLDIDGVIIPDGNVIKDDPTSDTYIKLAENSHCISWDDAQFKTRLIAFCPNDIFERLQLLNQHFFIVFASNGWQKERLEHLREFLDMHTQPELDIMRRFSGEWNKRGAIEEYILEYDLKTWAIIDDNMTQNLPYYCASQILALQPDPEKGLSEIETSTLIHWSQETS